MVLDADKFAAAENGMLRSLNDAMLLPVLSLCLHHRHFKILPARVRSALRRGAAVRIISGETEDLGRDRLWSSLATCSA